VIAGAGDLAGRDAPPPRADDLVHRQAPPDIRGADELVHPGVGHEDHVGVGAGDDGRQRPARPRRQHVGHVPGAGGQVAPARPLQPPDAALPPARCPVAALREDHQRAILAEAPGQALDLLDEDLLAGPAPGDEDVRHPVGHDVHAGVKLHRGLHHDAGPPQVHAEQLPHEQERVAGSGVAAEHDHRAGRPGRLLLRRELRLVDVDPDSERRGGRAVHQVEVPPHDRVVTALVGLGVQPAAEPGGDPQAQAGQQRGGLPGQPDEREVQQPQAAPAAGGCAPEHPERHDQQREQRGQGRDRHSDHDHQRREHQPAYQPGWEHAASVPVTGSGPGQPGKIAGRCPVRALDTRPDLRLVTVAEL